MLWIFPCNDILRLLTKTTCDLPKPKTAGCIFLFIFERALTRRSRMNDSSIYIPFPILILSLTHEKTKRKSSSSMLTHSANQKQRKQTARLSPSMLTHSANIKSNKPDDVRISFFPPLREQPGSKPGHRSYHTLLQALLGDFPSSAGIYATTQPVGAASRSDGKGQGRAGQGERRDQACVCRGVLLVRGRMGRTAGSGRE